MVGQVGELLTTFHLFSFLCVSQIMYEWQQPGQELSL